MKFSRQGEVLGRANWHGYAHLAFDLGKLPAVAEFPIQLIFTSNPGNTPGLLGPAWRMPLIDSSIIKHNRYNVVWEAPDGERYFFTPDRDASVRTGEEAFRHRGDEWNAVLDRRGNFTITNRIDPRWFFEYRNGRLDRFALGSAADVFRVQFTGRGVFSRILSESNNRPVVEVEFKGDTPVQIRIGDTTIGVQMGSGKMLSGDGRTDYSRYRQSFLRRIELPAEGALEFEYSLAGTRRRQAMVEGLKRGDRSTPKVFTIPLNRMEISGAGEELSHKLEWEATSGFIVADEGGSYEVKNDSYDPHTKNPDAEQPKNVRVAPWNVSVKRHDASSRKESSWAYDWASGVLEQRDGLTGESKRRTYIMAEGPAHGKLRKTEENDGKGWKTTDFRVYDSLGRVVRRVQGKRMTTSVYGDSGDVTRNRYEDGRLAMVSSYVNGKLVERLIHGENGEDELYRYSYEGGARQVEYLKAGEMVWQKAYLPDGRLAEMSWADGRSEVFEYLEEGMRRHRILADGTTRVYFQELGEKRFVELLVGDNSFN